MSAARPAASARPPGSGSTDRPQGDFGAHIRHPKLATYHPSGALAPPLLILQPAVHSCAACLAAVLLSAQVLPPANGCPGFAHQVLASRRKMSSVKPCPVTITRPALGVMSLRVCPPVPSKPPSAALFSLGILHASALFAVQAARASLDRSVQRTLQH